MDHLEGHFCPRPTRGMLPWRVAQAACHGRTEKVCQWLSEGGDINAGDNTDQTLLHFACQGECLELVKKLLQYPDIHLDPRMSCREGFTPLAVAATQGFKDIVEVLLQARPGKCVANQSLCFPVAGRSSRVSSIMNAANFKHWSTVRVLLQYYHNIRELEAYHLFVKALEDYEFDIALEVIQQKHPFRDMEFGHNIFECYQNKKWELVETIFHKNLQCNNDSSKKLLYVLTVQKNWSRLETLLRLMNDKAKIHVRLVEAILEKKQEEEVTTILEEVKNDEEVMAGSLLVATIGGSSEEVADLLVNKVSNEYSNQTLNNALILGSLNSRLEFLPHLLKKKRFTYQILCQCRVAAESTNRYDASNLIHKIINDRVKELSSQQKEDSDTEEEEVE